MKFPRGKQGEQAKLDFLNEIKIIRSLASHHHIIRVFGTYQTLREGVMILQPAASHNNLALYLDKC